MECYKGDNMRSYVWKEMNRAIDQRISRKKKEAQKNSLGGAKNQASAHIKNSQNSSALSNKKQGK